MFDQFKAMGAVADLLRHKDKMEASAKRVRERLEHTEVVGEAGGGSVRVTVRGTLWIVQTEIAPALAQGLNAGEESEREMAQQLISDATNDGLMKAQLAARKIIEEEAAALGFPGLLSKLDGPLAGLLPGGNA